MKFYIWHRYRTLEGLDAMDIMISPEDEEKDMIKENIRNAAKKLYDDVSGDRLEEFYEYIDELYTYAEFMPDGTVKFSDGGFQVAGTDNMKMNTDLYLLDATSCLIPLNYKFNEDEILEIKDLYERGFNTGEILTETEPGVYKSNEEKEL